MVLFKSHRADPSPRRRIGPLGALACCLPLLLAACGGGGGDDRGSSAEDCSVAGQKGWLRDHMREWYFWYALAPSPDPAAYPTTGAYFEALLYTGGNAAFPADRWSGSETTESFNRFFGDGQSLGYGVTVAGLEVAGQPDQPLLVRYVEPRSPAATAGVQRGDRILSVNGRAAPDLIRAQDFSALTPGQVGQTLALELQRGSATRSVQLSAAVYDLTPVQQASVVTTAGGRRVAYLLVKDMVGQAAPGLAAAFSQFRSAGATDLVLDLRYNGGGLVSVAADVASLVSGSRAAGRPFASLLYNDKRAASNNQRYDFTAPAASLGLQRVYVLTGPRTCSASEQVVNGLRGIGVEVVAIGGTTCGKPVGFLPAGRCGVTYSAVNFESVNARNEGRYFDGFAPTCAVADDLSRPLGASDERQFAAAILHADTGQCPAAASGRELPMGRTSQRLPAGGEGERVRGMWAGAPAARP